MSITNNLKVNLDSIDFNNQNIIFVDNLTLEKVKIKYLWLLNAKIKDAIIGENANGIVWYFGDWLCGDWINGTWYSGTFHDGVWYKGDFYSYELNKFDVLNNSFRVINTNNKWSNFKNGIWKSGNFYSGTFGINNNEDWTNFEYFDQITNDFEYPNFRKYIETVNNIDEYEYKDLATWMSGSFFFGEMYDCIWVNGSFNNGYTQNIQWITGNWFNGVFNGHTWFNGNWYNGDFIRGKWMNGVFTHLNKTLPSRFGSITSASTYANCEWFDGTFKNGEFYSGLIKNSDGEVMVSTDHSWSIWYNGTFENGYWYGGHFENGNWMNGIWYSGVFGSLSTPWVEPDGYIFDNVSNIWDDTQLSTFDYMSSTNTGFSYGCTGNTYNIIEGITTTNVNNENKLTYIVKGEHKFKIGDIIYGRPNIKTNDDLYGGISNVIGVEVEATIAFYANSVLYYLDTNTATTNTPFYAKSYTGSTYIDGAYTFNVYNKPKSYTISYITNDTFYIKDGDRYIRCYYEYYYLTADKTLANLFRIIDGKLYDVGTINNNTLVTVNMFNSSNMITSKPILSGRSELLNVKLIYTNNLKIYNDDNSKFFRPSTISNNTVYLTDIVNTTYQSNIDIINSGNTNLILKGVTGYINSNTAFTCNSNNVVEYYNILVTNSFSSIFSNLYNSAYMSNPIIRNIKNASGYTYLDVSEILITNTAQSYFSGYDIYFTPVYKIITDKVISDNITLTPIESYGTISNYIDVLNTISHQNTGFTTGYILPDYTKNSITWTGFTFNVKSNTAIDGIMIKYDKYYKNGEKEIRLDYWRENILNDDAYVAILQKRAYNENTSFDNILEDEVRFKYENSDMNQNCIPYYIYENNRYTKYTTDLNLRNNTDLKTYRLNYWLNEINNNTIWYNDIYNYTMNRYNIRYDAGDTNIATGLTVFSIEAIFPFVMDQIVDIYEFNTTNKLATGFILSINISEIRIYITNAYIPGTCADVNIVLNDVEKPSVMNYILYLNADYMWWVRDQDITEYSNSTYYDEYVYLDRNSYLNEGYPMKLATILSEDNTTYIYGSQDDVFGDSGITDVNCDNLKYNMTLYNKNSIFDIKYKMYKPSIRLFYKTNPTWYNGTWYNGFWSNGTFKNGTFKAGSWISGTFENGIMGEQRES